jgi:hypothetical protein
VLAEFSHEHPNHQQRRNKAANDNAKCQAELGFYAKLVHQLPRSFNVPEVKYGTGLACHKGGAGDEDFASIDKIPQPTPLQAIHALTNNHFSTDRVAFIAGYCHCGL